MPCPRYIVQIAFFGLTISWSCHGFAAEQAVAVPNVAGRAALEAKQTIEAAGLVAKFQVGRAAPTEPQRFRVYDSQPPAGTQAVPRSQVLLTIFSGDVEVNGGTPPPTAASGTAAAESPRGEMKPANPFWIGVYSLSLPQGETMRQKANATPGIVVDGVYPKSPADAAGIRSGDRIMQIDDRPQTTASDMAFYLASRTSATKPVLRYERGGNRLTAEIDPILPPDDLIAATLQAAEGGAAWAQYEAARQFQTGRGGVPRDSVKAREWLIKSADQGFEAAVYVLGRMYLEGVGGERNAPEACRLLGMSADAGNVEAQYQLGVVYFHGLDAVRPDPAVAARRLHQAAAAGHGRAQMFLGCVYEQADPPDHAQALQWFQKSAAAGTAEAHAKIAALYVNGWGVPQSAEVAFIYYLKAAEAGDRESQFVVATLCRGGVGTHVDEDAARRWLLLSANNGEPRAQNQLGLMYQTGDGVTADLEQAEQWFRKAAEKGNPLAEFNLAFAAEQNDKPAEAAAWYRKAASHGVVEAEYRIGKLYAEGRGVEQNRAEALLWHLRAVRQGHVKARGAIQELLAAGNIHVEPTGDALKPRENLK